MIGADRPENEKADNRREIAGADAESEQRLVDAEADAVPRARAIVRLLSILADAVVRDLSHREPGDAGRGED